MLDIFRYDLTSRGRLTLLLTQWSSSDHGQLRQPLLLKRVLREHLDSSYGYRYEGSPGMKINRIALMLIVAASTVLAVDPVIWPMLPQDGTHNLYHSYGDYHRNWEEVTEELPGPNFHFGIDLTDPAPDQENDPAEDVFSVRHGYVRWFDWMSDALTHFQEQSTTTTQSLYVMI